MIQIKKYEPHEIITDSVCTEIKQSEHVMDWDALNKLYEEFKTLKKEKDRKIWIYQSSELDMLSYFVPYKQVLEIYKESNYLYGIEKWSATMLDRLCKVDSFNVDNYIDVTNVVTHTHNWSRIEHNLNKYIDMWLATDLPNSKDAAIKTALLTLDITDITLLNLASIQTPAAINLFNFNTNTTKNPHPISAQFINKIKKTGKINFVKPSKNKWQVLIRNNATGQVLMHPKLYHYWHKICSNADAGKVNDALTTYITNNLRITNVGQLCHFCKSIKSNIFDYYDSLCWECGNNAWLIRNNPGNAKGIRVCVTGCRHTVGYFTALELLRRGADFVLGTTRFPNIALETYKKEPDYTKWADKLHIIRADFLKWTDVTELISALEKYQINTYINNAFQTMPNTSDYLLHATKLDENPELLRINSNLLDHNKNIRPLTLKSSDAGALSASNPLNCNPMQTVINLPIKIINSIPKSSTDVVTKYAFGSEPSWKKPIAEIAPVEMITAGVINNIVPEIIISSFRKMPSKHSKFKAIINVSSSEGLYNVQSSVTGGHKNHMQHLINCLRLEKEQTLIAYTADPGFITGIFGKKHTPRTIVPLFKKINSPEHNILLNDPVSSIGLTKALTAQDGAMRVIYPLLDYIEKGVKPGPSYR